MKLGNVLVIYHAKCLDGFSAAVVMKHWLLEEGHALDEITLHPGVYGEPPPEIEGDTAVAVLDFSYSMEIMRELARKASGFLWIDHHQTAIDAYAKAHDSFDLPPTKHAEDAEPRQHQVRGVAHLGVSVGGQAGPSSGPGCE